jgi:hypothetical protein
MTPQEALAEALQEPLYEILVGHDGRGVRHLDENLADIAAAAIAALPEGWRLTEAPDMDELRKLCREIQDRSFERLGR